MFIYAYEFEKKYDKFFVTRLSQKIYYMFFQNLKIYTNYMYRMMMRLYPHETNLYARPQKQESHRI